MFVCKDADLNMAAKRVIWGRMMNAGQQCIAPDYVLVEKEAEQRFFAQYVLSCVLLSLAYSDLCSCKQWIEKFYEGNPMEPGKLGRIVNDRHMQRLERVCALLCLIRWS